MADVLEKLIEFIRHNHERDIIMAANLESILAKLDEQRQQTAAQGQQLDRLIADRDAKEQSDLQKISDLLDENAEASQANADKVSAALGTATEAPVGGIVDQGTGAAATAVDPATGQPISG